jgi:uncharacterized membrane protein YadS
LRLPDWLKSGVQTELYVKIGLVLLGATILFRDILTAGSFGLIQAVIVVTVVWYFSFWLSRKMKVDDEFSTMLASAVSICGVSAAIATAGAINGEKGQHIPLRIIWERFPKFVLGFILASLVFSFVLSPETAQASGKVIKSFSTFWFNLAFISIGLETRFSDFKHLGSKKPFYSFLIAQTFNIFFTLGISYLLFQIISNK